MANILQQNNLDEYGYPTQLTPQNTLRKRAIGTGRRIALTLLYIAMSGIGGILWLMHRKAQASYAPLTPKTFHPRRILVVRVDLIGDLVMSLTAVRALKRTYPEAEIDLLALPSSATILSNGLDEQITNDPDISHTFTYNPNIWRRPKALLQPRNWYEGWKLHRRLKARHYDLAISLYGNVAAILAVLSGAKRRLGFGREGYPGFLTENVAGKHWMPEDHLHEVDYCLKLAQAAGATIHADDRVPQLYVAMQAHREIERLLAKEGISTEKPLIACHVSSHNGQAKRWPIPYWATLLDRLSKECDAQIVLTGASNDLPLVHAVMQRMHTQAFNMAGKTTLAQLAALFLRADLVISGDSGPMHIAEAVDTPLIALHGPTDPALSGPTNPKAIVLRSDIWCSPCYDTKSPADCRFHTIQCMKNLTPNRVFDVACQMLKEQAVIATGESE